MSPDTESTIIPTSDSSLTTGAAMTAAGQAANKHARKNAFADYLARKADNTIRAHRSGLARFAEFLTVAGVYQGDPYAKADRLMTDPTAWQGVTFGIVEGFRNWLVLQGEAVATINLRLSTLKVFTRLAFKAGVIDATENALIRTVSGYAGKEAKRLNERRETTRRGRKKAQHTPITPKQAKRLKQQPDTPQGRRDAVIMCLLIDHGLRCGEVAGLQVSDFDLKAGEMRFYRPKVDKEQTHKLSADTARALAAWFDSGEAPAVGPLLRGSRKGGTLTSAGMSENAISARVRMLGKALGIDRLSAHDCRHYWATFWADKVDLFRLQEAGGWSSLVMPRRYVEEAQIANEGMA
jgi:integrase